jgi:phosphate transport system protein
MFKNLLSFWKGKDFLAQVLDEFKEMLDDTRLMYEMVCSTLLENVEEPDLKKKIYETDGRVNKLQKKIRTRIVEHLSLQPTVDVNACLLLMSVVKDAERLGDYCKNLYEVTEIVEEPIDRALFSQYFNGLDEDILTLFERTKEAFIESDKGKAESSWDYERRTAVRCDHILKEIAKSSLSVNEAVCFALIARHFKRIVAHLTNIATSVILPLSELDYYDESRAGE